MSVRSYSPTASLALALLASCGPGGVAEAARPEPATAAAALGETDVDPTTCHDLSQGARPLVVDWKATERADLEVAMQEGVAVVKYSCKGIELLTDCQAEGSYGFKGVVLKQELVRLANSDEVRANLPLTGIALAAKLEGEFKRGSSLNLATALVGKQTSTRLRVSQPDLAGRCKGATHFVRSANIGAFVLQTGSNAGLSTAAELFGVGADAKSSSERMARNADGDLASCKKSTTSAESPPDRCRALVRLQLLPIDAQREEFDIAVASAAPRTKKPAAAVDDCPGDLVLSGGKCTSANGDKPHACKPNDLEDCQKQCALKEAASCSRAATLFLTGRGTDKNAKRAKDLFEASCELDYAGGCSNLGVLYAGGTAVAQDDKKAAELFSTACNGGDAIGCFNLASMHFAGRGVAKDLPRSALLYRQACDAGKAAGCVNLGAAYESGQGVGADLARAYSLFKRACEGEAAAGCTSAAFMIGEGRGTGADPTAAVKLYDRACRLGSAQGCESLGNRYLNGDSTSKDEAKGKQLLELACSKGRKSACPKP